MRLPRLRFRLQTLLFAVAMAALVLGYVQAWRSWPVRPQGAGYRIAVAVVARKNAERSQRSPTSGDPGLVGGVVVAALVACSLRRKGRAPRANSLRRGHSEMARLRRW